MVARKTIVASEVSGFCEDCADRDGLCDEHSGRFTYQGQSERILILVHGLYCFGCCDMHCGHSKGGWIEVVSIDWKLLTSAESDTRSRVSFVVGLLKSRGLDPQTAEVQNEPPFILLRNVSDDVLLWAASKIDQYMEGYDVTIVSFPETGPTDTTSDWDPKRDVNYKGVTIQLSEGGAEGVWPSADSGDATLDKVASDAISTGCWLAAKIFGGQLGEDYEFIDQEGSGGHPRAKTFFMNYMKTLGYDVDTVHWTDQIDHDE